MYNEQIFKEGSGAIKIKENIYNNIRYADETVLMTETRNKLRELVSQTINVSAMGTETK